MSVMADLETSARADAATVKSASLSNSEATEKWSTDLTARSGITFHVRPAAPGDEAKLAEFFRNVSHEDLYHRFLTTLKEVDHERLAAMTRDDDPLSIDFLAFDKEDGTILATAMLTTDDRFEIGEFALCTRADRKHLGISWTLLEHLISYARATGLGRIRSLESWDDHAALQLEREMGFEVRRDRGDATLMIAEKNLSPADRPN